MRTVYGSLLDVCSSELRGSNIKNHSVRHSAVRCGCFDKIQQTLRLGVNEAFASYSRIAYFFTHTYTIQLSVKD